MGGISTSATSDETILPNAAPMMIPIAMSSTFPCNANFLNSCSTRFLPGAGSQRLILYPPASRVAIARSRSGLLTSR